MEPSFPRSFDFTYFRSAQSAGSFPQIILFFSPQKKLALLFVFAALLPNVEHLQETP